MHCSDVIPCKTGLRSFRTHLTADCDLVGSRPVRPAAVTFALAWLELGSLSGPSPISLVLGLVVAGIGAGLITAGRREYASRSRVYGLLEDKLITTGIYQYSRNPQYVGYCITLLGSGVAGLSLWTLILALGVMPILHFYIRGVEEPHLRSTFGEEYLVYCNNTPRYLRLKN